jgi:hypothetical protein
VPLALEDVRRMAADDDCAACREDGQRPRQRAFGRSGGGCYKAG